MFNGEKRDIEAPDFVELAPKKNKPYTKRIAFTLMALLICVLYFVFSSGGETEEKKKSEEEKVKYQSALQSANDISTIYKSKNISGDALAENGGYNNQIPPGRTPEDFGNATSNAQLNSSNGGETTVYPNANDGRTTAMENETLQVKNDLKRQWREHQKNTYVANPNVQGEWTSFTTRDKNNMSQRDSTAQATNDRRNDYLEAYEKIIGNKGTSSSNSNLRQSDKEAFFNAERTGKGYLSNTRTASISPYVIPSGSLIPCALITGINSDLPGNITASVTENVYDWSKAHICLIPQGSRIFGTYDSKTEFAQKRVQIAWSRLIFPDGSVINLEGMPGVDRRGYSGLKDKHYAHYGRMFVATIATTAFSILPQLVTDSNKNSNTTNVYYTNTSNTAGERAAEAIGRMGNKFFDKSLNVNPTILVRPGTRFNVQTNADIPFYKAW